MYLIPWEESKGLQGLALDWANGERELYPVDGAVDKERPSIRLSHADGHRILQVVTQATERKLAGITSEAAGK